MKKLDIRLLAAVMVVSLIFAGCAQPAPAPTEKPPVVIGHIASITGVTGDAGEAMRNGALVAANHVNEAGGILDGRMIELKIYDNKSDPDETVTVANKLIYSDEVKIITGIYDADKALALRPIAEAADVLIINNGMTWTLPSAGYRGVHAAARSEALTRPTIKWIHEAFPEAKTLVNIAPGGAWGLGVFQGTLIANDELGTPFEILDNVIFPFGAPDVTADISKVLSYDPDVVFSATWGASMIAKEIKTARELGYIPDKPWIFIIEATETHLMETLGYDMLEGVYAGRYSLVAPEYDMNSYTWDWPAEMVGKGNAGPTMKRFTEDYLATYGIMPIQPAVFGYDFVRMAAAIVDYVGSDDATLDEYLEAFRHIDYVHSGNLVVKDAITPIDSPVPNQIVFDTFYMTRFTDGKCRVIAELPSGAEYIAPPELYEQYEDMSSPADYTPGAIESPYFVR
jgi:branched-chain amino acid transport system substrate-binding protein